MTKINGIDYSVWNNQKAIQIAKNIDQDGVKGLQGKEIFDFVKTAKENKIEKTELFELMGLNISKNRAASLVSRPSNPEFDKAVEFYNKELDLYQRSKVTSKAYDNLETRMYNMEKSIDNAFLECEAYADIVIVPRWHYRFYPLFDDKLINFDIDEIRERTTKDMASLNELRDKVEYIIEEANGETEHTTPKQNDYDVEKLAQKHLGMSYEEFAEKYKDELEFCKTVTYADLASMNETQRMVYAKAKAYAKEMLEITINEAHNTNWDIGDRKVEETLKASGDMFAISDFEDEGITDEGIANLKSGIMFKAFEEALIAKYREMNPTSVYGVEAKSTAKGPKKVIVNGVTLIYNPDGSVYNLNGQRIK